MKKIVPIVFFSLLGSVACSHTDQDTEISVSDCLIQAPVADGKISAAFFTLHNNGQDSVQLTAVESNELSKNVQIHEMIMKDGMMEMSQIPHYDVTPGEHFFKKGGYHIMLEDLEKAPQAGESYPLTLHFSDEKALTCQAKVLTAQEMIEHFKQSGDESHDHGHMNHNHEHHDHGHMNHNHEHHDHDQMHHDHEKTEKK